MGLYMRMHFVLMLYCVFHLLCCLQQIRRELLDSQLKVASLQDMSLQLLVHAVGQDCLEAKEKVHVIGNRLKLLLKEVSRHIRELERNLDITSSQQVLLVTACCCFFSSIPRFCSLSFSSGRAASNIF